MAGNILGGGTKSQETTQTASGSGRNFGNRGQNVESGAIGVGAKGKYSEEGSFDLSGSKITGPVNISVTPSSTPSLASNAPAPPAPMPTAPAGSTTADLTNSTTAAAATGSGFKTWIVPAVVAVLLLWFLARRKKK